MSEGVIYVQVPERVGPEGPVWKSLPLSYKVQVAGEIVSLADLWECWRKHGHVARSEESVPSAGNLGPSDKVAKKRVGRRQKSV